MKITSMLTVMVALLLCVAGTLLFAAPNAGRAQNSESKPRYTGTLTAKGDGRMQLFVLKGTVVTLSGTGDLMVPVQAKIKIDGNPGTKEAWKDRRSNRVIGSIYKNLKGKVTITGDQDFFLAFKGKCSGLTGKGVGTAMLFGKGTYATTRTGVKGKTTGKWAAPERPQQGSPRNMKRPEPVTFGDFPQRRPGQWHGRAGGPPPGRPGYNPPAHK